MRVHGIVNRLFVAVDGVHGTTLRRVDEVSEHQEQSPGHDPRRHTRGPAAVRRPTSILRRDGMQDEAVTTVTLSEQSPRVTKTRGA